MKVQSVSYVTIEIVCVYRCRLTCSAMLEEEPVLSPISSHRFPPRPFLLKYSKKGATATTPLPSTVRQGKEGAHSRNHTEREKLNTHQIIHANTTKSRKTALPRKRNHKQNLNLRLKPVTFNTITLRREEKTYMQ